MRPAQLVSVWLALLVLTAGTAVGVLGEPSIAGGSHPTASLERGNARAGRALPAGAQCGNASHFQPPQSAEPRRRAADMLKRISQ